jgi:hypothetical protein
MEGSSLGNCPMAFTLATPCDPPTSQMKKPSRALQKFLSFARTHFHPTGRLLSLKICVFRLRDALLSTPDALAQARRAHLKLSGTIETLVLGVKHNLLKSCLSKTKRCAKGGFCFGGSPEIHGVDAE